MTRVLLSGFVNLQIGSSPDMQTYTGNAGEILDLPDGLVEFVVSRGLGEVEDADASPGPSKPEAPPPRMTLKHDHRNGRRKGR